MEEKECTCNEEHNCECKEEKECTCNGECKCEGDHKNSSKLDKKKEKNKYKKQIEELENKNKDLENALLIAKADLVNYRKRKDEETVRLLKFCNEDLIKKLLPVLDNFERAIKLDDDNLDDEVSKFLSGFKMIYCNMQNIMENFEVKPIDNVNVAFDPIYHNAIMMEKKDGVEAGVVIEVLQKGYIYKDKVIRPAMVKVSEGED